MLLIRIIFEGPDFIRLFSKVSYSIRFNKHYISWPYLIDLISCDFFLRSILNIFYCHLLDPVTKLYIHFDLTDLISCSFFRRSALNNFYCHLLDPVTNLHIHCEFTDLISCGFFRRSSVGLCSIFHTSNTLDRPDFLWILSEDPFWIFTSKL